MNNPTTLADRICLVIDGILLNDPDPSRELLGTLYTYVHLNAGCGNPHADWLAAFEKVEAQLIADRVIPDIRNGALPNESAS